MSGRKILETSIKDGRRGERRKRFFERKGWERKKKGMIEENGKGGGERMEGRNRKKGVEGEESVGREERKKEEGLSSIVSWNVTGLENKDVAFWTELGKWNVIGLVETWVEKRGWGRVEGKLPKGYVWRMQWTKRRNKKGRACGGILFGVRRGMKVKETRREGGEMGRMMIGRIRLREEFWRIGLVYMQGDRNGMWKEFKSWTKVKGEDKMLIGGDFNARTEEEGGEQGEDDWVRKRSSKDKKLTRKGESCRM